MTMPDWNLIVFLGGPGEAVGRGAEPLGADLDNDVASPG